MKNFLYICIILLSGCVTRIGIEDHSGPSKLEDIPATQTEQPSTKAEVKEIVNEAKQ